MSRRKTICVDNILDAAETIVAEIGVHRLTLDNVAEKAGISKGGLTYSFGSKEALIRAMSEREISRFRAEVAAYLARHAVDEPFPQLSARIAITREETDLMVSKAASMAATLAQSDGQRSFFRQFFRSDLDGLNGASDDARRARVAFLALEGLFLLRGLGFLEMAQDEWEQRIDEIRAVYLGKS